MKYVGLMNTTHPGSKSSGWRPENMIVSYRDPLDKAARVAEEVHQRGLKVVFFYGGLMGAKSRESAVADFHHVIDICATMKCGNVLMGGLAETRGRNTTRGSPQSLKVAVTPLRTSPDDDQTARRPRCHRTAIA